MLVSNSANEVKRKIILLLKHNMDIFSKTKDVNYQNKIMFYVLILTDDISIQNSIERMLDSYRLAYRLHKTKNLCKYIKKNTYCNYIF